MNLPTIDHTLLPPELVLDPKHPANDEYIRNAQNIQRAIVAVSKKLSPRAVQATKLKHKALPTREIAERLNVTPTTISKLTKSKDAKTLLTLLGYYASLVAGPHVAQRTAMLWRIATDNESKAPRTAIAALAELNKVDLAYKEMQTGANQKSPIVVINQETLPRTVLDGDSQNPS